MLVWTVPGTAGFNVAGSSGGPGTWVGETQEIRAAFVFR